MTKSELRAWMKKHGYGKHGGQVKFCRESGMKESILSNWLSETNKSPLPAYLPAVLERVLSRKTTAAT